MVELRIHRVLVANDISEEWRNLLTIYSENDLSFTIKKT